nr:esterase [uncultured bacterium]
MWATSFSSILRVAISISAAVWSRTPPRDPTRHPRRITQTRSAMTVSTPHNSATFSTVGLLWAIGPAWYVLCEAITAIAFKNYNYATFYISDLGVPTFGEFEGRMLASQVPQVMNAGFIGAGLFFLLGLVLLLPHLRPGAFKVLLAAFGLLHAVGIVFVGLVPGSPENAESGLMLIHVLGAFGAIAGGNLAAISSSRALNGTALRRSVQRLGLILGVIGLGSALILTQHWLLPDGVWERMSVYTFMLWQFVGGIACLRSVPTSEKAPILGKSVS